MNQSLYTRPQINKRTEGFEPGNSATELCAFDQLAAHITGSLVLLCLKEGPARLHDIAALVAAHPGVRLALGDTGAGWDGFRRSHEQAVTARLVALTSPRYRGTAVVSHADPHIALVALLLKDAAATRIWIREVLGPLADAGEQNRIARETLATYYAQGENAVRTAEALGLHRNTVRQRIAKLENDRAGFRGDALQIALALRVYDDFDPIDPTQGGG